MLTEELLERFFAEYVDAHAGQVVFVLPGVAFGHFGLPILQQLLFGLFDEGPDTAVAVHLHDAESRSFAGDDRNGGQGHVCALVDVVLHQLLKIHLVELIAAQDEHVVVIVGIDVVHGLAHGVGGALVPLAAGGGLLGGQHVDEARAEAIELVGVGDVRVERGGVVLREHEHAAHSAIQTIRNRDVDQSVLSSDGHGGLGAVCGEGIEARARAAAEDDRDHFNHGGGKVR